MSFTSASQASPASESDVNGGISFPLPQPRFQSRMLVTLTISARGLKHEFARFPEILTEIDQMEFKRYHAYIYVSTIYDPLGLWRGPDQPTLPPPERTRIALIGSCPPGDDYFDRAIKSLNPGGMADMCHPIALTTEAEPGTRTEQEHARKPIQVRGPTLSRCKFDSAYVYTSKKIEVTSVSLNPSARGSEISWTVLNEEEDRRLARSLMEDGAKMEHFRKEYEQKHPEEPPVGYTMEDGKLLLDGIESSALLAQYSMPVEIFLDLDDQDTIEDPSDFDREVIRVRKILNQHYKELEEPAQTTEKRDEILTWADSVRSDEFDAEFAPRSGHQTEPKTLFQIGLAAGFLFGVGLTTIVFSHVFVRSSHRM